MAGKLKCYDATRDKCRTCELIQHAPINNATAAFPCDECEHSGWCECAEWCSVYMDWAKKQERN